MFRQAVKKPKPNAYVLEEKEPEEQNGPAITVQAKGARVQRADRARTRIQMCAVLFVFVFAVLGVRLSFISFGDGTSVRRIASESLSDIPRPEIVDRNGALLTTDLPMVSLEIAGREVWDAAETVQALSAVLPNIDAVTLERKLSEGRYVEVQTDLTPTQRQAVFDLGLPGTRFATRTKRFYPQADLAAHVIGHGEPGKGGVMGLENVANRWHGDGPMRSTLDIRVQQILEGELSAAMEKFSAKAAWGAMMDVETGEVIALASLPDFDPNAPGAAPADFRRNRATYDRYELGSAFKTFTAAAALEVGVATEDTPYDARGSFKVADRRITDFHGENRILTLSEVIQFSSNIGVARIVGDLGAEQQKKFLKKLGFFGPLDIGLPENRDTELPAQWGPVEAATIAYGHGISVTPLHLLAGFSATINGGDYKTPYFVAGDEAKGERVFSPDTSAAMRRILRRVIINGTASYAEAPGYYPIGKTATADKPVAGGYDRNTRIASFVGAFPGYAPRYAVIVSLDEPQPLEETFGYATAGWTAAPVFASVVERAAPILGVAPVSELTAVTAFMNGELEARKEARLDARTTERAR